MPESSVDQKDIQKLGELQQVYGSSMRRFLAPVAILLLSGLMTFFVRQFVEGREQRMLLVISIALMGLGSYVIVLMISQRNMGVKVYEKGLLAERPRQQVIVRWNSVARLWQDVTTHTYTVELRNGKKLQFTNDLRNVDDLGTVIGRKTSEMLLEKLINDYDKQRKIDFELFSVSTRGFATREGILNWENVSETIIDRRFFTIREAGQDGSWLVLAIAEIPNFHVFRDLMSARRDGFPTTLKQ